MVFSAGKDRSSYLNGKFVQWYPGRARAGDECPGRARGRG